MKKTVVCFILFLFLAIATYAQDFGYTTTDAGGEYQWNPDGAIVNLQFAFNSKIHNSFLIRAGYNKVPLKSTNLHNGEEGSGWGGSLGYRYYFNVVPRRFYIGIRADLWKMNIHFSIPVTESTTKLTILQPGLEAGFTLLLNELVFITPYISAGKQITLNIRGDNVDYGHGFIPSAGISAGFRF
jgi:hypothetical protein